MNIIREIREEIKSAYREPSIRDLNILALLFLVIPALIGGYILWRRGAYSGYVWIGVGVGLALSRLVPPLFRLIYRLWISFSVVLGYFISRVILTLVFYLVMTPTGLLMRVLSKDPMERKIDPNADSYWIKREPQTDYSVQRYEKQF